LERKDFWAEMDDAGTEGVAGALEGWALLSGARFQRSGALGPRHPAVLRPACRPLPRRAPPEGPILLVLPLSLLPAGMFLRAGKGADYLQKILSLDFTIGCLGQCD